MEKADLGCLTERHLQLFGAIIQWFARYEWLMQEVMATVAGSNSGSVMLLTRGLDFSGKRQALFDLLRHRTVPLDRYDRINGYLMVPHTLTPLRDDIAHSTWIPGPSSNSIQPDWILRLPPASGRYVARVSSNASKTKSRTALRSSAKPSTRSPQTTRAFSIIFKRSD